MDSSRAPRSAAELVRPSEIIDATFTCPESASAHPPLSIKLISPQSLLAFPHRGVQFQPIRPPAPSRNTPITGAGSLALDEPHAGQLPQQLASTSTRSGWAGMPLAPRLFELEG